MTALRVAGADPGTSSLDLVVLEDGLVADQVRFAPDELLSDPAAPVRWLEERGPLALVAGPSGYGLPLVRAADVTEEQIERMSLVRPNERGRAGGVAGFGEVVRAFCRSGLPVVFLPGVIHLATVPGWRKVNRIDLGTPDKLCVAALALAERRGTTFCVVELGTAFSACVVVRNGRVVDGLGGTSGPVGWGGCGAWDGEVAYLLSPLSKDDLFHGGAGELHRELSVRLFRESLVKAVAGLQAVTPFDEVVLSGRLREVEPDVATAVTADLGMLATVRTLEGLPDAWVKHAAQGAAVVADGLAGGRFAPLVATLELRSAAGDILSWLRHPGAQRIRPAP